MKHGKKPTREQCKLIQEANLKPEEWFVVKDQHDQMLLVYRTDDKKTRIIPKEK